MFIERSLKKIDGYAKTKVTLNEPATCNPNSRLVGNQKFNISPRPSNKASTEIETELIHTSHGSVIKVPQTQAILTLDQANKVDAASLENISATVQSADRISDRIQEN